MTTQRWRHRWLFNSRNESSVRMESMCPPSASAACRCPASMGRATMLPVSTLIRAAIDRGVTLIDTSDMYGWGHNEQLVGRAIAGQRDKIVLATKFGNLGGKDGKFADGRPEYVVASCDASLKRLGVDVIDLYYQHRIDPNVPIEDTVGAMARPRRSGQGARAWPERGAARHHSPRPQGAPDRGSAERISRCSTGSRPKKHGRPCARSASRSSPIRRLGAGYSPPPARSRNSSLRTTRAGATRALPAPISMRNRDLVARIEAIALEERLHTGAARARLATGARR